MRDPYTAIKKELDETADWNPTVTVSRAHLDRLLLDHANLLEFRKEADAYLGRMVSLRDKSFR